MLRTWLVPMVSFVSFLTACGERSEIDRVPSEAEVGRLAPADLATRFSAVDARLSRLGPAASAARADAGHAARLAFDRTHDPRFARLARRWSGSAILDRSPGGPACRARVDLGALDRALGDLEAARTNVTAALGESTGDLACRDALRRLASELGIEVAPSVEEGTGTSGTLTSVELLGAGSPDAAGVRLVVALDSDARGELLPTVDDGPRRVARLRFGSIRIADEVADRDVGRGGLQRVVIAEGRDGLDLILDRGATVRASVVADPTRWILDVDRAPVPESASSPSMVVVIDPGHGGDEHGATVDGVRESRLVLDIATRAASELARAIPGVRVVLTRTTDDEVSLEQRAALANALDADVFVSIHANDADVPVTTGGITTFVLDTGDAQQALRLAARENGTTTDRVSGLSVLLAGIHRESQAEGSRRLAEAIHASALSRARRTLPGLPDRGVKQSQFYVLVGTRMPSVLLECSFMTRPEELAALRTEAYRQSLAEGVAEGIARYLRTP